MDAPRIEIVTQLRSYQHATNIRGEVRQMAGRAADDIDRLRAACERMMIGGNHIALYRTDKWPDYKLDGLTREQQVDSALRILGAGREYDMWCCWSTIMQARDTLNDEQAQDRKP